MENDERAKPPVRCRVLVVDDHTDVADALADLLQQIGCETRVAYDGVSAVASAIQFQPEVVVLDLRLPDMTGDEVCRLLRALPGGDATRIIALTGWSRGRERPVECFDEYLVKPVGAAAVLDLLMDHPRSHAGASDPRSPVGTGGL